MRKKIVKIMYFIWSLKRVFRPHLGEIVRVHGHDVGFQLIQGVNKPYWDLLPLDEENLKREKRIIFRNIHERNFIREFSLKKLIYRFKSSYKFQMMNWYSIDVRKKIFSPISYK